MAHYEARLQADESVIRERVETLSHNVQKALADSLHSLLSGKTFNCNSLSCMVFLKEIALGKALEPGTHSDSHWEGIFVSGLPNATQLVNNARLGIVQLLRLQIEALLHEIQLYCINDEEV